MTAPVFPAVPPERGHYESFYLRAVDPSAPRGIWLRHTVHQRPGHARTAALWCVLFERGRPPAAVKQTVGAEALAHGDGALVRIGEAAFGPTRARGRATSALDGTAAEWDLAIAPRDAEPLRHLPAAWMYGAPLPRTKTESALPHAAFDGRFAIGDRAVELDGWAGMTGHNWGAEHAERWLWLNALALDDGAWLDLAIGRVRVGPALTPWIANGALSLDGRRHRLGGLERIRATRVAEQPHGCRFVVRGEGGIRVEGRVDAPAGELVGWRYADPAGGEHHALNCSIAAVELHVRTPGGSVRELRTPHGGVYELGTRDTDHGIPVRPDPDG